MLKDKKQKKASKKLDRYIEYICKNNPDTYLDKIREDIHKDGFEKMVEARFSGDPPDSVFSDPNYEEEVRDLVSRLKSEKNF